MLSDDELLRYSRHILLEDFDIEGQLTLKNSHALIIGAGGLGCPAALYLASSGLGTITICDDDRVEVSNLQRQIAHGSKDIGKAKVESLAQSLLEINPLISVQTLNTRLSGEALINAVKAADIVLDCSDNFSTRFAINKACINNKTPLVSAAAIRAEAQLSVFDSRDENSPCYNCLYQEQDNESLNCSDSGVLAAVVGIMGSWQALEAIKVLSGFGETLIGKLLVLDLKYAQTRQLKLNKDPNCPCCSKIQTPQL